MSFSGLSKADKEIIAQSSSNERALEMKRLFGMSEALKEDKTAKMRRSRSASANLPLRELRERKLEIDPIKERDESPAPDTELEPDCDNNDEEVIDEEDDEPGASWDKSLKTKVSKLSNKTLLEWNDFVWKPHHTAFLKGVSNWLDYKEDLLIEIQSIGYEPGMRLTPLDEIKLAGAIRRTTTSDARTLIRGMKQGTKIMKLFEATFQQVSELQQDNYWEELSSLKYRGDCPITYVTKFKTAIHNYKSVGGLVPSVQAKNMFKASSLEQLYQDFVAHLYHKTIEKKGNSTLPKNDKGGSIYRTQRGPDGDQRKSGKDFKKRFAKSVECWNCKKKGNYSNKCPDKLAKDKEIKDRSNYVDSSISLLKNKHPVVTESDPAFLYTATVSPSVFEDTVNLYEEELEKRQKLRSLSDMNTANVAQQVLSTRQLSRIADRWLYDTGADVDATNCRENLIPGTIVEIKPGQFPVQTGNGMVHAECMGEVLLSLMGAKGERKTLHLKHVLYIKELPHNLVSGERFYKRGGRQEGNRLINFDGTTLTYIDVERRGFFLWLHGCPEPLKSLSTSVTTQVLEDENKNSSLKKKFELAENQEFQAEYKSCVKGGVFKMSDEIMRRLILWHRRLCHPSADRLKWTIMHTVGIDLDVSDVKSLPCEACDMGKSLKYTTKNL
ncbi:hypothetical protein EV44_g3345 [Erysiphe necator]|uniref:Uncharacterized protein n=1 Tax=Uncinula necator TaxID=52586 RepID=A0A0B1P3X2_UNCNE|nr:hypothetical protein EV44_g3345 [Erysiphe necator]